MQTLDAGTGQNALSQLDHFQKAVGKPFVASDFANALIPDLIPKPGS